MRLRLLSSSTLSSSLRGVTIKHWLPLISLLIFLLFLLLKAGYYGEVLQCRSITDSRVPGCKVTKQTPHDLAASGLRQRIGESDFIGFGETSDAFADVGF